MPELPEVESVRTSLARHLPGRSVRSVHGDAIKLRRALDPEALADHIVGKTFDVPERTAKFLMLPFRGDGGQLLVHLGMTGRVVVVDDPGVEVAKHTHLSLDLDDGRQLRYIDARRFGFVDFVPHGQVDASVERLGLDPLADDFVDRVVPELKRRGSGLKNLLMDQSIVGGLGNIYVTEALFRAGIHPQRPGKRTSEARLRELATACREILDEAIAAGGTTLRDYADPDGRSGDFVLELAVYGRQGEPCQRCGTELKAMTIANRTTAYCPTCQR